MLDVNDLSDRIQALRAKGCDSPLMATAVSALERYDATLHRSWLRCAESYIVAMERCDY